MLKVQFSGLSALNNVENNLYALLVYSAAVYCMYSTVHIVYTVYSSLTEFYFPKLPH